MSDLNITLPETPGLLQVVLAVYVPDQGWVATRPGPTGVAGSIEDKVVSQARAAYNLMIETLNGRPRQMEPVTNPIGLRPGHTNGTKVHAVPSWSGNSCRDCGGAMVRTGSCETCTSCGSSGGCG